MFLFDILEAVLACDLVEIRFIKEKEVILMEMLMIKAEDSN